jgi:hypothetical protein
VFRAIFRACHARFRECVAKQEHVGCVTLEFSRGREGQRTYSRKNEEYIADFCIIARRALDDEEHQVLRYHYLLGADWRLCCRRLKMDRGSFFHMIYRLEQKLGRAFSDTQPYGIFPVDEYFGGKFRKRPERAQFSSAEAEQVAAIRQRWFPPLLRIA